MPRVKNCCFRPITIYFLFQIKNLNSNENNIGSRDVFNIFLGEFIYTYFLGSKTQRTCNNLCAKS